MAGRLAVSDSREEVVRKTERVLSDLGDCGYCDHPWVDHHSDPIFGERSYMCRFLVSPYNKLCGCKAKMFRV